MVTVNERSSASRHSAEPTFSVTLLSPDGGRVNVERPETMSPPLGSAVVLDLDLTKRAGTIITLEAALHLLAVRHPWLARVVHILPAGGDAVEALVAWQRSHSVDLVTERVDDPGALRRAVAGATRTSDLVSFLCRHGIIEGDDALELIAVSLDTDVRTTVPELASSLFVHPSTLARTARRLGLPPAQELLALSRCVRAVVALQADDNLEIGRVGIRVGYASGSAFSDACMTYWGVRPRVARRMFGPRSLWCRYWTSDRRARFAR